MKTTRRHPGSKCGSLRNTRLSCGESAGQAEMRLAEECAPSCGLPAEREAGQAEMRLAEECAPSCGLPAEREAGQAEMRLAEECATVVRLPTVVGGNAAR